MKKLIQIALLALLATSLLALSANARGPMKFGIKGGFNSATVTGDDADGWKSRSGFVGGAFARLALRGPIGIQVELLMATKGAKTTITEGSTTGGLTLKADYFELPVLLRYGFKGRGPAGFSFYGGPVFAFSRSSKSEVSGTLFEFDVAGSVDTYNEKSTDLGVALGVGLDLAVSRVLVVLDVRYTMGMQNMWEDVVVADIPGDLNSLAVYADETTGEAYKMKNSTISVTAGFMF